MRKIFGLLAISLLLLPACVGTDEAPKQGVTSDDSTTASHDESKDVVAKKESESALQDFTTTDSGLKYRIIEPGTDPKPTAECTVQVHYRGWLPDKADPTKGEEFDSSYKRGEPISFPLNGVIAGWTEGVQLVGKGGKLELEIPSNLAYGASGAGDVIPPNATLRFEIELLEFEPPPKPGPVDADAAQEFTKTESGLQYRVLRKGDGKAPTATDEVTVHYKGWFPDAGDPTQGEEFDSSYKRGTTTSFSLNGVIPGWTEGLQLVKEGGMIELHIPWNLAYGESGRPGIPPKSDLRFIVELKKVH